MPDDFLGNFEESRFSYKKHPLFIFVGRIHGEVETRFGRHHHDEAGEVIFVRYGAGYTTINGVDHKIHAGDIVLHNKGVSHEEQCFPEGPSGLVEYYYLGVGNLLYEGIKEGDLIPEHLPSIYACGDYKVDVENLMMRLFEECSRKDIGYLHVCQGLTEALIVQIMRIVNRKYRLFKEEENVPIVQKIKNMIDQNFNKDIKLSQIAERLHISSDYLSHVFKNKTGHSPINYLINRRIIESKKLMLQTNKAIKEIAALVGCKSPAYFSYLFKKETGIAPNAYREYVYRNGSSTIDFTPNEQQNIVSFEQDR